MYTWKKLGICFLSLIVLAVSCKKDSEETADNILYKKLDPSTSLSTVRFYTIENLGVCTSQIPTPSDSSTYTDIDVDADSKPDYRITSSHNKWVETQYCGHCSIYEYNIQITGLSSTDYISVSSNGSSNVRYYEASTTISKADYWNNTVYLSMQGGCSRPIVDTRDSYIGFKHNNKYGWIHIAPVSNNGIEVKEYAVNLTETNSVKAGQDK